jgi:hypothetical protein
MIFSDSASVLKGISNSSTIKLKDWNREEIKSNFTGSRDTPELKLERTDSETWQSIKESRDSQLPSDRQ